MSPCEALQMEKPLLTITLSKQLVGESGAKLTVRQRILEKTKYFTYIWSQLIESTSLYISTSSFYFCVKSDRINKYTMSSQFVLEVKCNFYRLHDFLVYIFIFYFFILLSKVFRIEKTLEVFCKQVYLRGMLPIFYDFIAYLAKTKSLYQIFDNSNVDTT